MRKYLLFLGLGFFLSMIPYGKALSSPPAFTKEDKLFSSYYITEEHATPDQYIIYFDKTKDCHGAKYCNVGTLIDNTQGNPTLYSNRNHEPITEKVILKTGIMAYFTPSHSMGDFWPPRMEWRQGSHLMQLSWSGLPPQNEKATLEKMANRISEANFQ